jgi:hypothetical protein
MPQTRVIAPGVLHVEDLFARDLMDAICSEAEDRVRWRRDLSKGTLYDGVILSRFAPALAAELHAEVVARAFPVIETHLGAYPVAHDRPLRGRVKGSPFSFVVKYGGPLRPFVPAHRDRLADVTLCVALNHGFEGGSTRFPVLGREVRPGKGGAVVFSGRRLLHEGLPVTSGVRSIATVWITAGLLRRAAGGGRPSCSCGAQVLWRHRGHATPCRRYSVVSGSNAGSSVTW